MQPRTDTQILARAPLSVKLGDAEYAIPLLAVMPQSEWRKKLFAELQPILEVFDLTLDLNSMGTGLTASLLQFPETLVTLVFAYREYGFAIASLIKEGVEDRELHAAFLALLAKGPLPEALDMPRDKILATATEEQFATAFAAISGVAFPFLPTLAMMRKLVKATAPSPQ